MDIISQVAACLGKLRDVRDRDSGGVKRSPLDAAWTFVRRQLLSIKSRDLPRELVDTLSPLLSRALPAASASAGSLSRFLDECVADLCRFQGALDARLRIRGEFDARLRSAVDQARQELRRENAIVLARAKEEASVAAAAKAREDVRQQIDLERASMEDDLRAEVETAHRREVDTLKVQHEREMTELRNAKSHTRVSQAMLSTSLGSIGSPTAARDGGAGGSEAGPSVLELQEELRTLEEELRRERQTFDEERTRLHQELAHAQKRATRVEADQIRAANAAQRDALALSTKSVSRRLDLSGDRTAGTHSPITAGPRRLTVSTPVTTKSSSLLLQAGAGSGGPSSSVWTPDRTKSPSTSSATSRRLLTLAGGHGDAKAAVLHVLEDPCSSPLLTDILAQLGSCLARLKDVERSSRGIAKKAPLETVWGFIQSEVFKTRQLEGLDAEVIDRLDGVLSRSVPTGRTATDASLVFFLESVIAELSRAHGTLEAKLQRNTQLHRARAKVIETWPSATGRPSAAAAPPLPPDQSAVLEGELVDTLRREYEDLLRRSRNQYARDVEGLTLMLEDEREAHDRVVRVTEARVRALCRREKDDALAQLRDELAEEKVAATEIVREDLERKIGRLQARVVAAESPSSRYHTLPPEVNPHFANLGPKPGSSAARLRDSRPSSGFGSSAQRFTPVHGEVMQWYEKPTETDG